MKGRMEDDSHGRKAWEEREINVLDKDTVEEKDGGG